MPTGIILAIGKPSRGGKMPEPPEPIGGKSKMPAGSKSEMPEEPEREMHGGAVSPDAVCFRTADEVCGNCRHHGKGGGCDLLGIDCGPGDSCNAFSQREDEEVEEGEMAESEGDEEMQEQMA